MGGHDGQIRSLFDAIRQLMELPTSKSRRIGFKASADPCVISGSLRCLGNLNLSPGFCTGRAHDGNVLVRCAQLRAVSGLSLEVRWRELPGLPSRNARQNEFSPLR